jgi:haloalkane dehalogenase
MSPTPQAAEATISAEFPFEPHYIGVLGSRMHYIEAGAGPVALFLHGNPTSSYLWRNVIPHVAAAGMRCVAIDLIGMGKSGKPDIGYRLADHIRYLDAAITTLGLTDITLVLHDWGSALGLHYAHRHPGNIAAIAMMEAFLGPLPSWDAFPADKRGAFQSFRTPGVGEKLLIGDNKFIEAVLPGAVVRDLTGTELDHYRAPFTDEGSRLPLWRFPNEIPIGGDPADVAAIMDGYRAWLQQTPVPKLLLHADPGVLVPAAVVEWARAHLPALTTVALGRGIHFVQEDHPHAIGTAIARWCVTAGR